MNHNPADPPANNDGETPREGDGRARGAGGPGTPGGPPSSGGPSIPGGPSTSGGLPSSGGSADSSGSSGASGLARLGDEPIVVPDDARELARDVEAWRREQRWLRRRARLERLLGVRRLRERGVSGPLIALILVTVGLFGATISILSTTAPGSPTSPVPLPLATPTAAPGTPHGLLPADTLSAEGATPTSSRSLRPGVVAIPAPGCDCADALIALARTTAADAIPVFVVGGPAQAEQLAALGTETADYAVHTFVDDSGNVVAAYDPQGLTIIAVHADGVTEPAIRDYTPGTALGALLADLKDAGGR